MTTSQLRERLLAASLIGFCFALAVAPGAAADPVPPPGPVPGPAGPPPAPIAQADASAPPALPAPLGQPTDAGAPADNGDAAATACKQFAGALNYAAVNYGDFADSIAGSGNYVNYGDPNVETNNTIGR
ncbi:MAG: hypothetical protein JO152_09065, partial [Mycobacteriaceae bacterium]|nr:hypothetical protein [Mycobacteriaceae bacterium]